MEKSDTLNINQMDMLFFDLRSFMPVSETLYSRKNTQKSAIDEIKIRLPLKVYYLLSVQRLMDEKSSFTRHCLNNHLKLQNCDY